MSKCEKPKGYWRWLYDGIVAPLKEFGWEGVKGVFLGFAIIAGLVWGLFLFVIVAFLRVFCDNDFFWCWEIIPIVIVPYFFSLTYTVYWVHKEDGESIGRETKAKSVN